MNERGDGPSADADDAAHRHRRGLVGSVIGRAMPVVMNQVDINQILDYVDIDAIAEELDLDALVERLDLDAVVERLDVNALAARLDLDALVARLDVNAVAVQLDLDALVDQLDVNAVAGRLDLDALVAQLDVNAIAGQLDLDMLVDRLDVNAVAARLDLDALVAELDVNAIAGQLDLDALVERMDVNAVAERLDMAKLTAGATQDVAVTGLDLVRRQFIRADTTVDRMVGGVLRRDEDDRPVAPKELAQPLTPEELEAPLPEAHASRRMVSGHYAGPVTRCTALAADVFGALTSFGFLGSLTLYMLSLFTTVDFTIGSGGWLARVLGAAWFILWFWVPVALFDRTIAMGVAGLAVVARDGQTTSNRSAFVRALVLPFSIAFLGLGLIGIFVGRERRALHDVVAGTVVVYDWGERDAEQPATVRDLLTAKVDRRRGQD